MQSARSATLCTEDAHTISRALSPPPLPLHYKVGADLFFDPNSNLYQSTFLGATPSLESQQHQQRANSLTLCEGAS